MDREADVLIITVVAAIVGVAVFFLIRVYGGTGHSPAPGPAGPPPGPAGPPPGHAGSPPSDAPGDTPTSENVTLTFSGSIGGRQVFTTGNSPSGTSGWVNMLGYPFDSHDITTRHANADGTFKLSMTQKGAEHWVTLFPNTPATHAGQGTVLVGHQPSASAATLFKMSSNGIVAADTSIKGYLNVWHQPGWTSAAASDVRYTNNFQTVTFTKR